MEYKFVARKQKHKIPSKLFPIESKKNMKNFNFENTIKIEDKKIVEILDSRKFIEGKCYTNSDWVTRALIENGYNAKFYSGWFFIAPDQFPVHHAWTIVDDDILIDVSINIEAIRFFLNNVDINNPNWREFISPRLLEFDKLLTSKSSFIGHAEFGLYLGSEDHTERAKKTYRMLLNNYPNHPSYKRPMKKDTGEDLQIIMNRKRLNGE